jgi:hypothetical protein
MRPFGPPGHPSPLRFGHELGQEGSPSRPDDGPPRLRRPEPLPSRLARPGEPAGRQTRRVPSTPKQEVPPILPHEVPKSKVPIFPMDSCHGFIRSFRSSSVGGPSGSQGFGVAPLPPPGPHVPIDRFRALPVAGLPKTSGESPRRVGSCELSSEGKTVIQSSGFQRAVTPLPGSRRRAFQGSAWRSGEGDG